MVPTRSIYMSGTSKKKKKRAIRMQSGAFGQSIKKIISLLLYTRLAFGQAIFFTGTGWQKELLGYRKKY
jgi:hypothetical protein